MPYIHKMNFKELTISPLGDTAIILNFGNRIDETLNSKVLQVFHKLQDMALPFVKDVVPGYSTLVIFYDLLILENQKTVNKTYTAMVMDQVKQIVAQDIKNSSSYSRQIKIPVCYSNKYALDIDDVSKEKKLPAAEIIRIHTSRKYRVYMTGFLPGFAYMGEVDKRIAMPRKTTPRVNVAAGSVGIAGAQTGIYPLNSPGGWQIIGKTPLRIFDKEKHDPVLLQPGDEIEFYPITQDEYTNY